MKFENTEVWGFVHSIRGARNPMNSHDKSDSYIEQYGDTPVRNYIYDRNNHPLAVYVTRWKDKVIIGENDMALLQKLIRAGSEHRKFMRQIFVSVDITAPLYWWKEFDTYKVGTVANSTSTMHKLASTPITLNCFETDDFDPNWFESTGIEALCDTWINDNIIYFLEHLRLKYIETKDKRYWKELIRWLPESWLQTRTITMNYENLLGMCSKGQRRFHKLTEWSKSFIDWTRSLPYAQELIFLDELDNDNNTKEEK